MHPTPTDIKLLQKSRVLQICFDDGKQFSLSCEYLRVYSPSAEVRGHGADTAVLQVGKQDVNISRIEPVGHYALTLVFDDNHDTGIYSWDYLYQLGIEYDVRWQDYIERLAEAGYDRKAD